jgi:hypothetical protein
MAKKVKQKKMSALERARSQLKKTERASSPKALKEKLKIKDKGSKS